MAATKLGISYWNVHGLHSQNFGCKLQITDFTSHLNKSDIFIIAETWGCKHTYNINGYEHFKITPKKKKILKQADHLVKLLFFTGVPSVIAEP